MKVVGVLKATGTPLDRSIFVPLSGFLSIEGHDAVVRDDGELQLSAIIVDTKHHLGAQKLRFAFQTRSDAQVAWTHIELLRLFQLVGGGTQVLRVVSWLVLVVASLLVLVALYNTMNERRREIAIMRSLGARRGQILSIILMEALFVSAVGAVAGILLCHGAVLVLADLVEKRTSVPLEWSLFDLRELYLVLGVTLLGGISGILPAVKGARTSVAENLAPTS